MNVLRRFDLFSFWGHLKGQILGANLLFAVSFRWFPQVFPAPKTGPFQVGASQATQQLQSREDPNRGTHSQSCCLEKKEATKTERWWVVETTHLKNISQPKNQLGPSYGSHLKHGMGWKMVISYFFGAKGLCS